MLIARDLRIDVGPRTLLEGATFSVQSGDRIGLVGRNGAGKTTLMKTLTGTLVPAEGTVLRSGRLGYFSQEAALPELEHPDATALERILMAREIGALQRRIEEARHRLHDLHGEERDRGIARFSRLHEEFETKGGFVAEAEAKRMAAALGIGNDELDQSVVTMSGGQRRRVELARILFAETDVLLLDEPTNHLDLDAKAWLIEWLTTYRGGMLVVSHDLPLLDEAITSVLALEHGELEAYRGNYSHYLVERDRRRLQKERVRKHQDEAIERLEENIRRFKGTTEKMAKIARSWETRVDRMKRDLVEVQKGGKKVRVAFPQPEKSGRVPLSALGLAKSFGDNLVFVDVEFAVERGERMLLIGLNGAGKTTLLRILAGVETSDLGEVSSGAQRQRRVLRPGARADRSRALGPRPHAAGRGSDRPDAAVAARSFPSRRQGRPGRLDPLRWREDQAGAGHVGGSPTQRAASRRADQQPRPSGERGPARRPHHL